MLFLVTGSVVTTKKLHRRGRPYHTKVTLNLG